jgi:hypothetical protein
MRIARNITYPLKIRKSYDDPEDINVWSYRDIVYNRSVNINSLYVDNTSSVTFTEPIKTKIPSITINSGELLLIDKDSIVLDTITISSGGEMRII